MAWHKEHKENSKDKILISAAELFTRHGFSGVSINQVMENAQLTRGAFYAHFASKSDLYAQAIGKAVALTQKDLLDGCSNDLIQISQRYLSEQHRDENLQAHCPLACLVSDINEQNEQVKTAYTKIFSRFVDSNNRQIKDKTSALQSAVLMIGGLALARALNDEALSKELLLACQLGVADLTTSLQDIPVTIEDA